MSSLCEGKQRSLAQPNKQKQMEEIAPYVTCGWEKHKRRHNKSAIYLWALFWLALTTVCSHAIAKVWSMVFVEPGYDSHSHQAHNETKMTRAKTGTGHRFRTHYLKHTSLHLLDPPPLPFFLKGGLNDTQKKWSKPRVAVVPRWGCSCGQISSQNTACQPMPVDHLLEITLLHKMCFITWVCICLATHQREKDPRAES